MPNDLTGFIPEIWSKKLAVLLNKNSIYKNITNTTYEGEIKSAGSVVQIRVFPTVPVNAYVDTVIVEELDSPVVPLAVDQFAHFAFNVDDISKAQADVDIISGYLGKAKESIDLAKDTRILSHVADADADNIISTSVMTVDNAYEKFVGLAKVLKKNGNVTPAQKPYVIINPDIEAILIQTPQFIQSGKLGEGVLTEGAIGRIAGLEVFLSTNMTDTAGTYSILAGHKDAIAFVSQVAEVEQIRLQTSFATQVRGLYVFGSEVVKPKEIAVLIVTLS